MPPPSSATGLLQSIADNALDDDYYVARPADRPGSGSGSVRSWLTALGLALFALLVTLASVQVHHDRPAEQLDRDSLVSSIQQRQAALAKANHRAQALRNDVARLQSMSDRPNPEYELLRVMTADRGASGPGIVVEIDNSRTSTAGGRITDTDLQLLINGLWYAGAEAIAVNDSRLSTLSAVHKSGQAITVNFSSIAPPYQVVALGDPESLADRLSENPAGRYWAQRVRKSGLRFDVRSEHSISVPAAPPKRVRITAAQAVKGAP